MNLKQILDLGALNGWPEKFIINGCPESQRPRCRSYNQAIDDCLTAEVDLSKLVDRGKLAICLAKTCGDWDGGDSYSISFDDLAQTIINSIPELTKGGVE
jgi:hypothetical protein